MSSVLGCIMCQDSSELLDTFTVLWKFGYIHDIIYRPLDFRSENPHWWSITMFFLTQNLESLKSWKTVDLQGGSLWGKIYTLWSHCSTMVNRTCMLTFGLFAFANIKHRTSLHYNSHAKQASIIPCNACVYGGTNLSLDCLIVWFVKNLFNSLKIEVAWKLVIFILFSFLFTGCRELSCNIWLLSNNQSKVMYYSLV